MTTRKMHLAQVNIALLRAPLDSPELTDFVAWLGPINAVADTSPGFVWRLQTEAGDATTIRIFDSSAYIVNLSIWESIESLIAYVYSSAHVAVLRRRREWFARMVEAHLALWWVAAGHRVTVREAEERLRVLRAVGPSPFAFTLEKAYPSDAAGEMPFDARAAYRRIRTAD